jgi:hypothetical protein
MMKRLLKIIPFCILGFYLVACSRNMQREAAATLLPAATQTAAPISSATVLPALTPTLISVPDAVLAIQAVLAQQLNLKIDQIEIVRVVQVDWPNACLGIDDSRLACAEVITPGYRIIFEVNGERYEYHTDQTGNVVRLASAPKANVGDIIVEWQSTGEPCQNAQIGGQGVAFGECGSSMVKGKFTTVTRLEDLTFFENLFAPFNAETPAGVVKFNGKGEASAKPAEQRMIAEWARLVVVEAIAGRSDVAYGQIMVWNREGGIAGFCDNLTVQVTGEVTTSSCKGNKTQVTGTLRLTAGQLQKIYDWMDMYKGFEFVQSDGAVADSMMIRLAFSGAGTKEASDTDQQEIVDFAARLFVDTGAAEEHLDPSQIASSQSASQALIDFFSYLEAGNYKEAAKLYGGEYRVLLSSNPDLTISDTEKLWERACTVNGYQCLAVKQIVSGEEVSPGEHQFMVEFAGPADSLFTAKGCCGFEEGQSQFPYIVKKIYGKYLVQDLPIYQP